MTTSARVRHGGKQAAGSTSIQRAANVLVTHDLLDAVALGDRMVVIENGAIVQTGTPAEGTARPRSRYVADLVGVNLLGGTAPRPARPCPGPSQPPISPRRSAGRSPYRSPDRE